MAKSTVGWFDVREKYCSLADKPWLINQIRPNEQADDRFNMVHVLLKPYGLLFI